jgi:hypothetical protein
MNLGTQPTTPEVNGSAAQDGASVRNKSFACNARMPAELKPGRTFIKKGRGTIAAIGDEIDTLGDEGDPERLWALLDKDKDGTISHEVKSYVPSCPTGCEPKMPFLPFPLIT